MSEIDLLTKRNAELQALIQGFRETVITEFFTCSLSVMMLRVLDLRYRR